MVEIPAGRVPTAAAPFVFGDIPGYQSPVTGLWVEGRRARREDLKRTGSRPWEGKAAEMAHAAKVQAAAQAKLMARTDEQIERAWAQLPPRMKRVLEGKATGYDP